MRAAAGQLSLPTGCLLLGDEFFEGGLHVTSLTQKALPGSSTTNGVLTLL
ncbi:hypothetical protein [Mycolicibacterium iranicum]|nr:hypothetical protein [Mycolicibacterium iranicum]